MAHTEWIWQTYTLWTEFLSTHYLDNLHPSVYIPLQAGMYVEIWRDKSRALHTLSREDRVADCAALH